MNILIVKISSMGDIIHTLPAITDVSIIHSNISFDWVVEETFSEIPKWHPFINKVIPIKLRFWKKKWFCPYIWKEYINFVEIIQNKKYDIIIDAQGLLKTSLFVTRNAFGIKYGMDFSSSKESMSCFFHNKRFNIKKNQHAIERIRQLFAYSLQYSVPLCVGQYNIKSIFKFNQKKCYPPYLLFFCFTTCSKKFWPELYWFFLINKALENGFNIKIPFWTTKEKIFITRLTKNFSEKVILLPCLKLKDIAIQILHATAIISVDTGLSHLAAALDSTNFTLYGPTNPKLIGIYGHNQRILQSRTKLMKHLTPFYVWETVTSIINYCKK